MNCCADCSSAYNNTFNAKMAKRDLARYKKKGPSKSTRRLLNLIFNNVDEVHHSRTLMDIGGGVGAIGLESIKKGIQSITSVDVSVEYRATAESEVRKRELDSKFTFITGDIVKISNSIKPANIVTLDKSICCYQDYASLVQKSVEMTKNIIGIVIPREVWWVIGINAIGNLFRKLKGDPFRTFVHPIESIRNIITNMGLSEMAMQTSREWQILIFQSND